jgi:hypothetical protein
MFNWWAQSLLTDFQYFHLEVFPMDIRRLVGMVCIYAGLAGMTAGLLLACPNIARAGDLSDCQIEAEKMASEKK